MYSKPNNTTVDFLSKLPTEIWQKIFSVLPSHAVLTADESTDPFSFLRTFILDHRTMITIQMERLALMMVCKTFCPLAEELLYSQVALSGNVLKNGSFQRAALQRAAASTTWRCRGDLTTYIQVFDILPDTYIFDLRLVCPYLRVFHDTSGFASSLNLQRMKGEEWSLRVTTLTVRYPIRWHDLTIMSQCFPKLTTLSVLCGIYGEKVSPELTMTFRQLRNLTVDAKVLKAIPFNQISLPSLRWLCVDLYMLSDFSTVHTFLKGVNRTLTGLWIHNRSLTKPLLLISTSVPGTLENLRTIIIHIDSDNSADTTTGTARRFPNLEHIVLVIQCRGDVLKMIGRYAHYFSSNATAPKQVTIIISRFHSWPYVKAGALDSVHGLFPGVLVELQAASDGLHFSTSQDDKGAQLRPLSLDRPLIVIPGRKGQALLYMVSGTVFQM